MGFSQQESSGTSVQLLSLLHGSCWETHPIALKDGPSDVSRLCEQGDVLRRIDGFHHLSHPGGSLSFRSSNKEDAGRQAIGSQDGDGAY